MERKHFLVWEILLYFKGNKMTRKIILGFMIILLLFCIFGVPREFEPAKAEAQPCAGYDGGSRGKIYQEVDRVGVRVKTFQFIGNTEPELVINQWLQGGSYNVINVTQSECFSFCKVHITICIWYTLW